MVLLELLSELLDLRVLGVLLDKLARLNFELIVAGRIFDEILLFLLRVLLSAGLPPSCAIGCLARILSSLLSILSGLACGPLGLLLCGGGLICRIFGSDLRSERK